MTPVGAPFNVTSGAHSASGWLAGGQVGYNYQIGSWVLGAEGSAATDIKGSNRDPSFADNVNRTRTDFLATIGARAGAGWAHEKFSDTALLKATIPARPGPPTMLAAGSLEDQATANRFALMIGAGVEYAIMPNWSVKAVS